MERMTPHAVPSSSLLAVHAPDSDDRRQDARDATGIAGFHQAFTKARALHEPRGAAASQARADHADRAARRERGKADVATDASTHRRADTDERHEADAAKGSSRDDAERRPARAADDTRRRPATADGRDGRSTSDTGATGSADATADARGTDAASDAREEPAYDAAGPVNADASALFAFLQPAAPQPLAIARAPLRFDATSGNAGQESSGNEAAGAGGKLGGALGATFADTDHTNEATLHHLSDAFARAEHLAARGAHAGDDGGALATEGMQLSSEARALLDAQGQSHAAHGADAAQAAQGAQTADAAKGQAATLARSLDGARQESSSSNGAAAEAVAAAGGAGAGAGASAHEARGEGGSFGQTDDRGDDSARDFGRDGFARSLEGAAAEVREHGAFGADPRVQFASKAEHTPEAKTEQAKAASERILQQIERITEQRNVGRDMIIATERGPVRVRVDIAEKQVSVSFRTEDEQLKTLLRSGLPALQSTLAKRGYAGSEFRFDGDGANDMMASGGRGKHAEARAMRESRLGEVMVEPVIADAAESTRRDPKALLSVTA